MITEREIYVALLNEGVPVWRPTRAVDLEDGTFKILPTNNYDPETEQWEFPPESIVICELKILSKGNVLVATRLASSVDSSESQL